MRKLCSPDCSHCTWLQAFLISVCLLRGPSRRRWSTSRFLRVTAVTFTALSLRFFCLLLNHIIKIICWLSFLYSFSSYLSFRTDNLLIDYQFTFSLIQEDDNHYTAINFMASPEQVRIQTQSVRKGRESQGKKLSRFPLIPVNLLNSLWRRRLFDLKTSLSLIKFVFTLSLIFLKANKNLDMSINASNNFNLNITWSVGSTGMSCLKFTFTNWLAMLIIVTLFFLLCSRKSVAHV